MTIETQAMRIEDFMQKYSDEGPFELINGESIPMSPHTFGSGRTTLRFFRLLADYVEANKLGEAFSEIPFVLTRDDTNWVKGSRVPDVMFYAQDRLDKYLAETEDAERKPIILVPDFVVEVVSPTDRFADVNRKVQHYLDDGVKLVWVIDPFSKTVHIHTPNSDQTRTVKGDATVSADPVVPGFEVALSELLQ